MTKKDKPGPKADRLILKGDWGKAIGKVLKTGHPTEPQKEPAPKKRAK